MASADELIRRGAAILSEAMEEAAGFAVAAVEQYGMARTTVCKRMAEQAGMPEAWNALDHRCRRLQQKGRSEEVEARARRTWEASERHTKRVLDASNKSDLRDIVEQLTTAQRRKLAEVAVESLPAFSGNKTGPIDISDLPKTGEARINSKFSDLKDAWKKYREELTPAQERRLIDKMAGWVAKIAASAEREEAYR